MISFVAKYTFELVELRVGASWGRELGSGHANLLNIIALRSKIGAFRPYIALFDPKMGTIRNRGLSKLIGFSCLDAFSS